MSAREPLARTEAPAARRLRVEGRVQGVGFRPFVYRLARELGIRGWVCNRSGTVDIFAEGEPNAIRAFEKGLVDRCPPLARPHVAASDPSATGNNQAFEILESRDEGEARIHVPPDQFACDDCLAEMSDPAARRYGYPFINCTQCGPRYTIIRSLPYDRHRTTMAAFPLCPECAAEYADPGDRRFHAQPLACPRCGPGLEWRRGGESVGDTEGALAACVTAIANGSVVAVRGIGGYHLVCDAASEFAVTTLRKRKNRPHKPLAVMVPEAGPDRLDGVRRVAMPTPAETDALLDPGRPIVLVARAPDAPLAAGIAPGLKEVGLMLPYSPLHHRLLESFGAPLVATSGNMSGEPVITDPADAEQRLATVADGFLHHDRPIERPADDPVKRSIDGKIRPVRIGRGDAPMELPLPEPIARPTLAAGPFMKNNLALAWDDRVIVSPHIGDLESPRSQRIFEQVAGDLQALYGVHADRFVHDAHPGFPNTRWARRQDPDAVGIWHHHAHASAAYGDTESGGDVICFTWDGTGLGPDGTVWGGEALVGAPGRWRRFASFRAFRLPGGDRVALEPWRTALSLYWETGRDAPLPVERDPGGLLYHAWSRGLNAPVSTAAGRLFDAAAVLCGMEGGCSYDGQAPMWLEAQCGKDAGTPPALPQSRDADGIWRADWAPLLDRLTDGHRSPAVRATGFHRALADTLTAQATLAREELGIRRVLLSGGVFQNRQLVAMTTAALESAGLDVLIPVRLPLNDAGIAYGQIIEMTGKDRAEA